MFVARDNAFPAVTVGSVILETLANLVLPGSCASCKTHGHTPLCAPCTAKIRWIEDACEKCASPKPKKKACGECATRHHLFERAASAAIYAGPVKDAIVAFKLLGERRAAKEMANWLLKPAGRLTKPDAITWVPSTKASAVERGFTPAHEIAAAFARLTRLRKSALLAKVRDTADQHGLTIEQRYANLNGVFRSRPVRGTVLLIDDVLTTGATANACTAALLEAGAAEVAVLTVGRATRRQRGETRTRGDYPISETPPEG